MRTFRSLGAYRCGSDLQTWLDRQGARTPSSPPEPVKPAEQMLIADPAIEAGLTRQAWRRRLAGEQATTTPPTQP
jgi:hypothetical protein